MKNEKDMELIKNSSLSKEETDLLREKNVLSPERERLITDSIIDLFLGEMLPLRLLDSDILKNLLIG